MEELVLLLEKITSADQEELKEINDHLASNINDPNFYQALILIVLNDKLDFNLRFSAIIYLKNCIMYKWLEISEITQQAIKELFFTGLINYHEPRFFTYILQISDLLTQNDRESDWKSQFEILFNSDLPVSSLILLRSLIFKNSHIDLSEILPASLQCIFSLFQSDSIELIYLKLGFSIIRRCLKIGFQFDESQIRFLIAVMMSNLQNETIHKFLPIFTSISRSNPEIICEIHQELISQILPNLSNPKVSIKFFQLFASFAENQELWNPFSETFIQLFLPFFDVHENDINDPISFINQHFFDSFSSSTDPNSAAFKCLEVVSQYQNSAIIVILQFLKQAFESNNQYLIYSASHMASAVLKNIDYKENSEKMIEFFNSISLYLNSESIFIQSASLILLSFESYLSTFNEEHVKAIIQLIFHPNEIISYFSINFLNKIDSEYFRQLIPLFSACPTDILISRIYLISQKFEVPDFTNLLSYLLSDPNYLAQATPYIIEIVNSAFLSIQFYFENDSTSTLVSFLFNIIITLIKTLAMVQFPDLLQFCKYVFGKCMEIINPSLYDPIFEILFLCIYYSPQSFEEMFGVFEIFMTLIDGCSDFSKEMIFKIFSIVLLKDDVEFIQHQAESLNALASLLINQYDLSDFSMFISLLIRNNVVDDELISLLICKINLAWKSDDNSFFDDLFELLTVLFIAASETFLEVFNDDLFEFLNDLIESAGKKELMMFLPYIFNVLPEEQKLASLKMLEGNENFEEEDENEYNSKSDSLPSIYIFSNAEIQENYMNFLSTLK